MNLRAHYSRIVELTRDIEGLSEDDSYDQIVALGQHREAIFKEIDQRIALYDKVVEAAIHVVNSADSTGCSEGLTVADANDVYDLQIALAALNDGE